MASNREKTLWKELGKRDVLLASVVMGILVIIYLLLGGFELNTARTLLLDVIANLIPVFLAFTVSYVLLRRVQKLRSERQVEEITSKIAARIRSELELPSEVFFQRGRTKPLGELLDDAKREIWVSGISLATMVTLIANLRSKLKQGYSLRFLALSPHGVAAQQGHKYSSAGTTQVEGTQKGTIIANYLERVKNGLSPFATREGQLEIRIVDRIPVFGFFIIDASDARSRMRVQIYPHQVEIDEAPLFELSKETDPKWYEFFYGQFEKLCDESEAYVGEQQRAFYDAEFADWIQYGKGNVSQSTECSHIGDFSLRKDGSGDPHGGYKRIGRDIGLGFVFSGLIFRPDKRTRGNGDRLAVEDDDFNGYGFTVAHYTDQVRIERRDNGIPQVLNQFSFTPPRGRWYQFKFYVRSDGELELQLYDTLSKETSSFSAVSDMKYRSFDRVVVHGGFPYFVDELEVQIL